MKALSLDIRERIVAAYDAGCLTRQQVADRFMVSTGLVKKLLAQRKKLGHIRSLSHRAGRKPSLAKEDRERLRALVDQTPDSTLKGLRNALGVDCSISTIHNMLREMGITLKKNSSRKRARPSRRQGSP